MTQPLSLGNCCGPSLPGKRKVNFPDAARVGLIGLDPGMKVFYLEGKPASDPTILQPVNRLGEKNYIGHNPGIQALSKGSDERMQALC
jgi:hypothetical protein